MDFVEQVMKKRKVLGSKGKVRKISMMIQKVSNRKHKNNEENVHLERFMRIWSKRKPKSGLINDHNVESS